MKQLVFSLIFIVLCSPSLGEDPNGDSSGPSVHVQAVSDRGIIEGQPNPQDHNVVNLYSAKAQSLISPFLGTYTRSDGIVNLVESGGQVSLWIQVGRIPSAPFQLDLNLLGKEVVQLKLNDRPYSKATTVQDVLDNIMTKTRISETLTTRMVEEWIITTNGTRLEYAFQRNYFKRSLIFGREWKPDQKSESAKMNTMSHHWEALKIYQKPMPMDAFFESTSRRSEIYFRLDKPADASTVKDILRSGDYRIEESERAFSPDLSNEVHNQASSDKIAATASHSNGRAYTYGPNGEIVITSRRPAGLLTDARILEGQVINYDFRNRQSCEGYLR